MQALHTALERVIGVQVAQVRPVHSLLQDRVFLYHDLLGPEVLLERVIDVLVKSYLASLRLACQRSLELLDRSDLLLLLPDGVRAALGQLAGVAGAEDPMALHG